MSFNARAPIPTNVGKMKEWNSTSDNKSADTSVHDSPTVTITKTRQDIINKLLRCP